MKIFTDAAIEALDRGNGIVSGAIAIHCVPVVRVWGGYGDLTIGADTYRGVGDRGMAQISGGALGGAAQNVTLTLSGIEPEVLELLDANEVKRAAVVIHRLIFSGDGRTLLDAQVFTRGRIDQLRVVEKIGGAATIQAFVETAARGLGRRGGRMRSDADQRLIDPTDGFFRNAAYAAEKQLYWGGRRPARAGSALGSGGSGENRGGDGGGRGVYDLGPLE